MIEILKRIYSRPAREKRAGIFIDYLKPSEDDKILDIGSEDGSYIAGIIPYRKNVFIADISDVLLNKGREKFGFNTILLDESGVIPYPDRFFDITFSSSVIEHVTVDKSDAVLFKSGIGFRDAAYKRQQRFADEIRRVSKRYFVQTPDKYFFIESHTWLPFFIVFFPRRIQIFIVQFFNRWWPKKTLPDWNLLTKEDMGNLFPAAEIILEKSFGFTKSIMAIKR